ncbi:MAG: DUF4198 domain-containing protein [Pelagibaca sp.]
MKNIVLSYLFPVMLNAVPAFGHEVWIEPLEWQVSPQEEIKADIFNGENFAGFALIWDGKAIERAEIWNDEQATGLKGRLGDRPALTPEKQQEGLVTLLYESGHRTVDYESYDKFASFILEKGHAPVLEQHAERRLSRTAIKEAYARFAKSLIQVGRDTGMDGFRGMEFELVALTNPYLDTDAEEMTVQLYYQGELLPDNRITVFERAADGSVSSTTLQTDQNGEASFSVIPGTEYLIDAVMLREPARALVVETRGAVWESLWASLTFKVPNVQ